MHKKIFLISIILILFLLFLTGCYDASGLETLAYVIALGIDKGSTNDIKLSLQIATLTDSSSSSGSSAQFDSATIVSVECDTIESGIALVNSYISKKINLSHCKAVIISEELATSGISKYVLSLVNNIELRPNCNMIISKCSAHALLENFKPTLESASARYYELIVNSSEYSGYTKNIHISDFYTSMLDTASQATAILANINDAKIKSNIDSLSNNDDQAYIAGNIPIDAKNKIEILGLAVFSEDKLVGELNNIENLCHLIITNKLCEGTVTIPSPFNTNDNLSFSVSLSKPTCNSVYSVNNHPYITSKICINAVLETMNYNIDVSDKNTLILLNESLTDYILQNIYSYLYKTSKIYKSDIVGFGKYAKSKYLTWNDWYNSDWLNNYENSFFNVSVDSNVRSSYLFTKF